VGSYALAATTSGLLLSENDGNQWREAGGDLSGVPILTVCISPSYSTEKQVWVGTSGGIAYSHDLTTWTLASLPQENIVVNTLAASPNFTQDGILLAGTLDYGVLRSVSRGSHWHTRNYGILDIGVLCLAVSPQFERDETALVGTSTGIYRTPNKGLAWRESALPDEEEESIQSIAFSPSYTKDGLILAGSEAGRLLRSHDTGQTWKHVDSPCKGVPINALVTVTDPQFGLLWIIAAGDTIFVSNDSGENWETYRCAANILCLASGINHDGQRYFLAGLQGKGICIGT
jgi:photosystem II stability/assembly factor-like uncharacterized protein